MAAELIDGKKFAAETRAQIAAGVAALKAEKFGFFAQGGSQPFNEE